VSKRESSPIEWYVGEEPPPLSGPEPAPPRTRRPRRRLLFRGAIFLSLGLVGMALLALGLRLRYEYVLKMIRQDIQEELVTEQDAIRTGDAITWRQLLDPSTSELWRWTQEFQWEHLVGQDIPLRVTFVHLLPGDRAAITVTGWPITPTIRGRVYRRVGRRWLWTTPTATVWGDEQPPQLLPCGDIRARRADAQAAVALSKRESDLCPLLEHLIGRPGPIRLILDPTTAWPQLDTSSREVVLPSPWLLGVDKTHPPDARVFLQLQALQVARTDIEATREREEALLRGFLASGGQEAPSWASYADPPLTDVLTQAFSRQIQPDFILTGGFDVPMRVRRMTLMGDWAWVTLAGSDTEGQEWYAVRFYHHRPDGRWLWSWGDWRARGPLVRLEGTCLQATYRVISSSLVRAAWEDWKATCARSRSAFGVPGNKPLSLLLSTRTLTQKERSRWDTVIADPTLWLLPQPEPPQKTLQFRLARNLALAIMKPVPVPSKAEMAYPFKIGMTTAYLLPPDYRIDSRGMPTPWPDNFKALTRLPSPNAQRQVGLRVGRYIQEHAGDEALRAWLQMVRYTYLTPDIADESSKLTVRMSFDELLRAAAWP